MTYFLVWMLAYPIVAAVETLIRVYGLGEQYDDQAMQRTDAVHATIYILTAVIILAHTYV